MRDAAASKMDYDREGLGILFDSECSVKQDNLMRNQKVPSSQKVWIRSELKRVIISQQSAMTALKEHFPCNISSL